MIVAALVLAVLVKTQAADTVFPGQAWELATPESQAVDSDKLQAAVSYLEQSGGANGVQRLVIVRHGRIIWQGPEADVQQRVWSVSKAFASTAHGLLIEDGKCSLDTLAMDVNPALGEHYPKVTLRHLATMTSGIDGVGGAYDCDDQGRCDANALVELLPPFFPPGAKYMYWDEATQHYGNILTRLAGEPLQDYLQRRVLGPIGITQVNWQNDSTRKVPNWTGGLEISARDLARFGHLYLHRGNWNGRQLISSNWVDQATRVQVPPSIPNALPNSTRTGSGRYGFHWWPNGVTPEGRQPWPDAPHGTYARSGYNNNHLFVLPAWNIVTVRLGLDEQEDEITDAEYNVFLRKLGEAILDPVIEGDPCVWHPLTIRFRGPVTDEAARDPNPFLAYRLQVSLTSPTGRRHSVPGFFDGDGHGGKTGNVWRVRFAPDEPGRWRFEAAFRQGDQVAISLEADAGKPIAFDGQDGEFEVLPRDPAAAGFLKWGRLVYAGGHYLKFMDGPYWIRGGTDEPENLLAYAGFEDTTPSHTYADHVADWRPGDPDWGDGAARGLIGAINYLASRHVNSMYLLTMNIGGDGGDVWPWAGSPNPKGATENDNLHFDLGKLRQWEMVFAHAQRQGVFLHFVLNEAEAANKRELDNGELGPERKLYYRELIARFGHHLALEWNLCEEYNLQFNFGPERVRAFADYIRAVDPYDHPITVHSAGDPVEMLRFTYGDKRFGLTSIQLNQRPIHEVTEAIRRATAEAGRPLPASLDEFTLDRGQAQSHLPVDDAGGHRREKLWPTYLSGGMIEFILDDLLDTDSFKTPQREALWQYVWHARRFMEEHLPFWEMEPADELISGAATIKVGTGRGNSIQLGPQVFAKPGAVYAIYLPQAQPAGRLDLSSASGDFQLRWYNPRTGAFEGAARGIRGREAIELGDPPSEPLQDWVMLVQRVPAEEPWVVYEGGEGPGKGKHIVFVAGEESYRSEESMPLMARILSQQHGFKCTVLFAIDPRDGTINPQVKDNIPGLEALATADLLVAFLRWRELPDEQMQWLVDYTNSGKPILGIRNATHPFRYQKRPDSRYARYDSQSKDPAGGWGRLVLGETWVSHYGRNLVESTRCDVAAGAAEHPILRGVRPSFWLPDDVYGISATLHGDCTPLLLGQPLVGWKPEDPAHPDKPPIPIAWTKSHTGAAGKSARVFTTTMGHGDVFQVPDFRRLIANACYWCLGMESQIDPTANVELIGSYEPGPVGGQGLKKGVRPADLRLR